MARISGVNIPTNKRVHIALTYIHGIGHTSAQAICDAVGIDRSRRVNELSDAEVEKMLNAVVTRRNGSGRSTKSGTRGSRGAEKALLAGSLCGDKDENANQFKRGEKRT